MSALMCRECGKLVEALRDIVNEAGLEFSDPRVSYETWQLDPGAIERGRAVLAAHRASADEPSRQQLTGVLCRVAQLLDGWHQDGTAWTEYDRSVRSEVGSLLAFLDSQRSE